MPLTFGRRKTQEARVIIQGKTDTAIFLTRDVKTAFLNHKSGWLSVYLKDGPIHTVDLSEYPQDERDALMKRIHEGMV